MTDIELNPQGEVVLNVDKSIYNESVIDKVLENTVKLTQ